MVWNDDDRLMAMIGVPFLDREILDVGHELNAGIVHQHVERAEILSRLADHGGDLGRLAHVGARIERLDAEVLLEAGALFLDRGLVAEAVEHDVGAGLGQRAGGGEPDAGSGAGDQRGFAFQHGSPRARYGRQMAGYAGIE